MVYQFCRGRRHGESFLQLRIPDRPAALWHLWSYRFGDLALFRNGLWFVASNNPTFSFGQSGDVAVHIGAKGFGNLTNRQNVIYGVYRAGTWLLDETGSGAPTTTVNFGGLSQDVPLLIPNWNGNLGQYSLAIYRDGTWFIRLRIPHRVRRYGPIRRYRRHPAGAWSTLTTGKKTCKLAARKRH